MTETPIFSVFLDQEKVKDIDVSLYPDGIPCIAYLALDSAELFPKKWVFLVDKDRLKFIQNYWLYKKYGESEFFDTQKGEMQTFSIPFEVINSVLDKDGDIQDLSLLQTSWILCNHAHKIDKVQADLDGETTHLIILGLQQALFIGASVDPQTNSRLFEIAINFIDSMSMGNNDLKEAYLTGFPYEYMSKARKLLFS